MKRRVFSVLLVIAVMFNLTVVGVSATGDSYESPYPYCVEGLNDIDSNPDSLIVLFASGLIGSGSLNASVNGRTLTISGSTTATGVMAQVGLKNVRVQRSSNGTSWTTEKTLGDFIGTDKATQLLSEKYTVTGGYYYRVIVTHYAKEQGWLLPSSQSIDNWTTYVWIG